MWSMVDVATEVFLDFHSISSSPFGVLTFFSTTVSSLSTVGSVLDLHTLSLLPRLWLLRARPSDRLYFILANYVSSG